MHYTHCWPRYMNSEYLCLHFWKINNYFSNIVCCVSGTRVLGSDVRFGASANNVMGLTSIDNKLFAVGIKSNEIFAMSADEPFTRSEKDGIEMTSLMTSAVKYPFDMTSSVNNRSMFVSDFTSKCLWRIGMDTKQIRRCSIDGSPLTLSTTAADELLVLVKRDKSEASRWNIGLYSTDDAFKRLRHCSTARGSEGSLARGQVIQRDLLPRLRNWESVRIRRKETLFRVLDRWVVYERRDHPTTDSHPGWCQMLAATSGNRHTWQSIHRGLRQQSRHRHGHSNGRVTNAVDVWRARRQISKQTVLHPRETMPWL